jgi:hypothetical protein
MKGLIKRLQQLERLLEPEETLKPVPVIISDLDGGFNCRGIHYATEEDAKAAFPDSDFCVVVQVVDGRKPQKEVVANA